MEDSTTELNLSNSGDENKTILLDETIDKVDSSNESEQDPNKQSTGSLKAIDLSDLIDVSSKLELNAGDLINQEANEISKDDQQIKPIDEDVSLIDKDAPIINDIIDDLNDDRPLEIVKRKTQQEIDEDEVEETIVERLIGLTEMFPDSVRNVGHSIITGTFPLIQKSYNLSRNFAWIFFSSFAILVVPVALEKERYQAQRDMDRQMLLGSGAKSSSLGLAPAPSVSK